MAIPGFEAFFAGWQMDLRLAVVPPILCAIFRFIFIYLDGPKKISAGGIRGSCGTALLMASGGAWILIPDFIC